MSVYCAASECKYNNNRNRCTAHKITLSAHSVMTAWQGRQEFLKCKNFELSEEAKIICKQIMKIAKGNEAKKEEQAKRLPCACEWCGHWEEEGCPQAHNCEDFEWRKDSCITKT